MSDEPIFYTPQEVADKLRVSKMTISRMIKSGEMPAYKVGGQYRISSAKLKVYMTEADTTAKWDEDYIAPDGGGITFKKRNKNDDQ